MHLLPTARHIHSRLHIVTVSCETCARVHHHINNHRVITSWLVYQVRLPRTFEVCVLHWSFWACMRGSRNIRLSIYGVAWQGLSHSITYSVTDLLAHLQTWSHTPSGIRIFPGLWGLNIILNIKITYRDNLVKQPKNAHVRKRNKPLIYNNKRWSNVRTEAPIRSTVSNQTRSIGYQRKKG